ncbi:S24/S26 family peptidase [Candidatus Curtissbacteria bacterium]|nr:S24/S26 family peptidase [Candidatus Curtissbacteria bacterium]
MTPAFVPGDHVLIFNWGEIKVGDVIVFKSRDKYRYFIKRIDKFVDNYVYVSQDNEKSAEKVEPFDKERVVGKVVLKY